MFCVCMVTVALYVSGHRLMFYFPQALPAFPPPLCRNDTIKCIQLKGIFNTYLRLVVCIVIDTDTRMHR